MPDILVRGMEMPKGCGECWLQSPTRYCYSIHDFLPKDYGTSNCRKHPKCQLHELPPHGDLISRDDLYKVMETYTDYGGATEPHKGIPTHSLLDSAFRHLCRYMEGETDEPHLVAAAWNILWAIWMEIEHPEMQDIPTRKVDGKWT